MSCKLVIFKTQKEKQEGLSKKSKIPSDVLYFFPNVNIITMEDTKVPIKIIFTDENYKILQVLTGKPKSKRLIKNLEATHTFECSMVYDTLNKFTTAIREHEEKLDAASKREGNSPDGVRRW